MSRYLLNNWHTTDLTLSVMARVARVVGLDIADDEVADKLYNICCSLESWPEGEGFGSSDAYSFIQMATEEFKVVKNQVDQ